MAFLSSMDISASALTAQRLRMDVISENVANINTTRRADGTPYKRRYVVMQEREPFSNFFQKEMQGASPSGAGLVGRGVRITQIMEDESPFKLDYNPEHPDADEDGFVSMPNVDLAREMVDMMSATRSFEANVTVFNGVKSMAMTALEIGK